MGNFPYNFSGNAFYNSVRSINVTVADSAGGWPCAWPTIADVENVNSPLLFFYFKGKKLENQVSSRWKRFFTFLSNLNHFSPSLLQDKLPEIQVLDPQTNATLGTIIADSLRVEFPTPGVPLMKRRWPVFIITGNIIPWTQYIVRQYAYIKLFYWLF